MRFGNIVKSILKFFVSRTLNYFRGKKKLALLNLLRKRWESIEHPPRTKTSNLSGGVKNRISVRVINLESRSDRLTKISTNLTSAGFKHWERIIGFNGKEMFPSLPGVVAGSIGCEISHISAISNGLGSGIEAIMICEDDLEFVSEPSDLEIVIDEFLSDSRLDILAISGRPRGGSVVISENLRIVHGLVGRGCYLIKPYMVPPLLEIFGEGLKMLLKGDLQGKGDLRWRKVQLENYFFAFPRKDLAQQSAGYSDIESRELGPR